MRKSGTNQKPIPPGRDKNQKVVEVSAGLIFRDGKLLITQRYTGAHLGGLWEFPGGKREANESFEQCLARELREELGIEVKVGELLESLTHAYPEKTVVLKFFRCELKQHEPQALGCLDLKWIGAAELRDYEFPAADARLLEKLQRLPELWYAWDGRPACLRNDLAESH